MSKKTSMTKITAARIQSAEAKKDNGTVSKNSFASRAQKAAAKNGQVVLIPMPKA